MMVGSGQHECCKLLWGRLSWEQVTESAGIVLTARSLELGLLGFS